MARLLNSPRQLILALRVLAVAAAVPLITRLSLPRQEAILEPRGTRSPDSSSAAWLEANIDRILAASHPLVRPGCLTRGLTHYYFLRRAGIEVRLTYGIGKVNGRTEGHCWLVRDGEPYLEQRDPRDHFTETHSIPRRLA
jgi:hypothetical protein